MRQKNYTRILALIVAMCMLAGVMVGIFVVAPLLLPFMLLAGAAAFVYYRYVRRQRGKRDK